MKECEKICCQKFLSQDDVRQFCFCGGVVVEKYAKKITYVVVWQKVTVFMLVWLTESCQQFLWWCGYAFECQKMVSGMSKVLCALSVLWWRGCVFVVRHKECVLMFLWLCLCGK